MSTRSTAPSRFGYFSKGIGQLPWLSSLLEAPVVAYSHFKQQNVSHIVGWGRKPTSERARKMAQRRHLPYVSLEDGFIRSLGLGVNGSPLHSLIVDHSGIYYDATGVSDLEQLIQQADGYNENTLQRAKRLMVALRKNRLSKYNHLPDFLPSSSLLANKANERCVLVIDQTKGDASVTFGQATQDTFTQMLEAAIEENPGAHIIVKVHPDVMAGKKQGYLAELACQYSAGQYGAGDLTIEFFADPVSPWALLDRVERVYTVTSQLGFEALLAGLPVRCFGLPFYAGWGLTEDEQHCERRGVKRTLAQVFAAAYIDYCRYINPYTGERCQAEDTVALLVDQRRQQQRLPSALDAIGFSRWKRSFLPTYLAQTVTSFYPTLSASASASVTPVLAWASQITPGFQQSVVDQQRTLWQVEDGFIRSVGLGIDRVVPLSLIFDSRGIYYDARTPSDLEHYLEHEEITPEHLARASKLRRMLLDLNVSKYNVGTHSKVEQQALDSLPTSARIILVPGQVETDASIARSTACIKSNLALLHKARESNPDAYIIYKPHPDVLGGGRYGAVDNKALASCCDLILRDTSMPDVLNHVDEVHTISSLTGFEALLRDLHVVTYGLPFYAGWGLTEDHIVCPRRQRRLSLEMLIAGALIWYPLYIDPKAKEPISVETAVTKLALMRHQPHDAHTIWRTRLYRLLRNHLAKF